MYEIVAARINTSCECCFAAFNSYNDEISLDDSEIDWELFTEPKKKKKMWAWLVTNSNSWGINIATGMGTIKTSFTVVYTDSGDTPGVANPSKRAPELDFEMDE